MIDMHYFSKTSADFIEFSLSVFFLGGGGVGGGGGAVLDTQLYNEFI